MAHTLNIVYGSTTLSLTTGSYRLVAYSPRTAGANDQSLFETLVVQVSGTTAATLMANVEAIDLAFEEARQYAKDRVGDVVRVNFQPDSASQLGRSRIFDGRMSLPESVLKADWANLQVEVEVTWEREPFWEMPEETLLLTNRHGTSQVSAIIFDHSDSAHDNFANIAAGAVDGDLPAPAILELSYHPADAYLLDEVYYHLNWRCDPAALDHDFEGEAGGGTPVSVAGYSNGQYVEQAVTADTDDELLSWTITNSQLADLKGNWVRILMAGILVESGGPVGLDCKVWIMVADDRGTLLWTGPKVLISKTDWIHDLGVTTMPPIPFPALVGVQSYTMKLYARTSATTYSVRVDYLHILPCDSAVHIVCPGTWDNVVVYDDGVEDVAYLYDLDVFRGYLTTNLWGHLMLQPGKAQRVYVSYRRNTGGADLNGSTVLTVKYRPRRRTL